jgi:hypothetical protein
MARRRLDEATPLLIIGRVRVDLRERRIVSPFLLLLPLFPVSRPPPAVRHGKDLNSIRDLPIDDDERKAMEKTISRIV